MTSVLLTLLLFMHQSVEVAPGITLPTTEVSLQFNQTSLGDAITSTLHAVGARCTFEDEALPVVNGIRVTAVYEKLPVAGILRSLLLYGGHGSPSVFLSKRPKLLAWFTGSSGDDVVAAICECYHQSYEVIGRLGGTAGIWPPEKDCLKALRDMLQKHGDGFGISRVDENLMLIAPDSATNFGAP